MSAVIGIPAMVGVIISFLCLIIGVIKPDLVNLKGRIKTRTQAFRIYSAATFSFLLVFSLVSLSTFSNYCSFTERLSKVFIVVFLFSLYTLFFGLINPRLVFIPGEQSRSRVFTVYALAGVLSLILGIAFTSSGYAPVVENREEQQKVTRLAARPEREKREEIASVEKRRQIELPALPILSKHICIDDVKLQSSLADAPEALEAGAVVFVVEEKGEWIRIRTTKNDTGAHYWIKASETESLDVYLAKQQAEAISQKAARESVSQAQLETVDSTNQDSKPEPKIIFGTNNRTKIPATRRVKTDTSGYEYRGSAPDKKGLVYYLPNSKRYHRHDCSSITRRKNEITAVTIQQAKSLGLTPCKRCKPPE